MNVTRGYKTELSLNNQQATMCRKHTGAARFAYNWGLARKIAARAADEKSPSAIDLHRELNQLKKGELAWMYEVSKCAPQQALRNLDVAFVNFFRRAKLKKQGKLKGRVGFPRFKSKHKGLGSFTLYGSIHIGEQYIQLPRVGRLRLKEAGYVPTSGVKVLSATVSEQAGHWFVSVQVEQEQPEPVPATGEPIGVDLGVKTMAVCSNGVSYPNPKALTANLARLKRSQRSLSRRQKGSKNRTKARARVARLHYRIACMRQDALHKATSDMVAKTKPPSERPRIIVVEDLAVSNLVKNHKLARAISEVGFAELRRQLAYKCKLYGTTLLIADRFYPSSKRCSNCGAIKNKLLLSERTYRCADCGFTLDRDLNAALNLKLLADRQEDTPVDIASDLPRQAAMAEAGTQLQLGLSMFG